MRRSKTRVVPHRRKREGRTDYRLRLRVLKSGKPRLVVRKSLNSMLCQIVRFDGKTDRTVVSAASGELERFGWKCHGGNLPSAYLTGFLCAQKAKGHKISEAVLDIGLYRSTPGNRLYSALKGAVDGGLALPHSEKILPPEERFTGKHVSEYAKKLEKDDKKTYKRAFSAYIKQKIDPKKIPEEFEKARKKIASGAGKAAKSREESAKPKKTGKKGKSGSGKKPSPAKKSGKAKK